MTTPLPFDPARWPRRERLSRAAGLLAAAVLLGGKVLQLPVFPGVCSAAPWLGRLAATLGRPAFDLDAYYGYYGRAESSILLIWWLRLAVWLLETGILLGYAAAFATRLPAKSVARGFRETALPLLVAGLPFLISLAPYTYARYVPPDTAAHVAVLAALLALILAGEALNLAGLLALRRSFSLMSEARALVTTGPYRLMRHPLYTGHFAAFLAYTVLHFSPASVLLYAAFVAGQRYRARVEEEKLAEAFPEYAAYRARAGMFLPRWR